MNDAPSESSLPILAVFDFDGTLTLRDSLFPFLKAAVGEWRFYLGLVLISPALIAYALRLIPNWKAKETVLGHFLSGMPETRLQALGEKFATQALPKLLRTEAVERLRWHQEQGHKTVLVSASPEIYLKPWAKKMAFNEVIGTRLETPDGTVTGRISGENCYGPEKVRRLSAALGELEQYCIYAYGDSKGDRELLNAATYPYYRTFVDQTSPDNAFPSKTNRWERGIVLSAIAAVGLYLAIFFWSGAEQFLEALGELPIWLIPALMGIVFFSYCLRFARWQWYLHRMGYSVPLAQSFQIFLASFALTASPGKAGESIKSLFLNRRYQIPVASTIAGLFCERFTDALSVVLLIFISLFSAFQGQWAVILVGVFQILLVVVLQHPPLVKRWLHPLKRWPKLNNVTQHIETSIDSASILLKPKILVGSTFLALLAWGLEGVSLYLIFQYLGTTQITVYQAILTHTASGLLGALTFLPGGIGGTEALTISFAMLYGASRTNAVTATILIRLLTLWYAVALGLVAMISIQRKSMKRSRKSVRLVDE